VTPGVTRLLTQRGDESICEVSADRLLQALESRLLANVIGDESGHVRKDTSRGRGSDLCEHGGAHATGIGVCRVLSDPWRE
jgi:hypothetical protein